MSIKTIGIMTGNSLDAVDAVLTEFDHGSIKDLATYTLKYPVELTHDMIQLRSQITGHDSLPSFLENNPFFASILKNYTLLVAETVNKLCEASQINKSEIAAIGWHGQTCDHFPPSIAGNLPPYTLQIADPQRLANLTDIPVIYDFRSDDIMNGGEGAPLAPTHNKHIADDLKKKGIFPVAFCNAGNTGNITIISETTDLKNVISGWDTGPFNHFPDMLVRLAKSESCDLNARYGKQGQIIPDLLDDLFNNAAITNQKNNFFLQSPPRSSDPTWYRLDLKNIQEHYGFKNSLRTIEYFSAYTFFHTLAFVPENVKMPNTFLLFGGGWKNPVIYDDFQNLLHGKGVVLDYHKNLFSTIRSRFSNSLEAVFSDKYGYSGAYMEARIFADMAYCRITAEPFSFPESTGCKTPTVAGIYVLPQTQKSYLLSSLLEQHKTTDLIKNDWDKKYNRAAKGWQNNIQKAS